MKGIILAGGLGSRLYPLTQVMSKQLLPVYDKPMIYYSLSVLMLAGITDILLISTESALPHYKTLFGDGSPFGINISYAVQETPRGIADAFLVGESFIRNDPVCLILGDNIFYGDGLPALLQKNAHMKKGAVVYAYYVNDPERYGVLAFKDDKPIAIVEKPTVAPSQWAVTGLYFYDSQVVNFVKDLQPSKRGELEITDLNNMYLERNQLQVEYLGRGMAWLDTGTHQSLLAASHFVEVIESRQGLKMACLEEIAYRMGTLSATALKERANQLIASDYGQYLQQFIIREGL